MKHLKNRSERMSMLNLKCLILTVAFIMATSTTNALTTVSKDTETDALIESLRSEINSIFMENIDRISSFIKEEREEYGNFPNMDLFHHPNCSPASRIFHEVLLENGLDVVLKMFPYHYFIMMELLVNDKVLKIIIDPTFRQFYYYKNFNTPLVIDNVSEYFKEFPMVLVVYHDKLKNYLNTTFLPIKPIWLKFYPECFSDGNAPSWCTDGSELYSGIEMYYPLLIQ